MPAAPPMNKAAPSTLVTKKPIATGTPSPIRPSAVPKRSVATQYQAIAALVAAGQVAQGGEEVLPPPEEARELDRHHEERDRDPADDHPARHVERAHVLLVLHEVLDRHLEAVPGDHQADGNADEPDQPRQPGARPRRQRHEQDLDVDVALLAREPRRPHAG